MWDAGILAVGLISSMIASWLGFRFAFLPAAALAVVALGIVARQASRTPTR
jgi:hypothetical protein